MTTQLRRSRRPHRFVLATLAIGLVAAITLFAAALPAAASGGSGDYAMTATSTNITAGDGWHNITFTTSNVTGGSGGSVCFEPHLANFTTVTAGDFSISPDHFDITNGSTATQTIQVAVAPDAPAGSADLSLVACDGSLIGSTGTSHTTINVGAAPNNAPVIVGVTPTSGPNGIQVQIQLAAVATVTGVTFGSNAVTSAPNVTSNTFFVDVPDGNGTVDVTVSNSNGATTLPNAFTYTPAVTGVSPSSGPAGTVVTVSGSNFTGLTSVMFGAFAVTIGGVTNITDSSFNAVVPSGPGLGNTVHVVVTTNTGSSTPGTADEFTYAATAGPTITAVSGQCTIAGGGTIDVTGTAFVVGATATIGGIAANITVNSATSATVTCPAQASAGSYPLVITSNAQATNAFPVTYLTQAAPTVTGVSPAAGPAAGGNTVTITGTGFQNSGLGVAFGSNAATGCVAGSSTSITCTAPGGTGTVDVVVTINSVSSATSSADQYTYTDLPVITSISPTSGGTGTSVTITGANFASATGVSFGTTAVANSAITINSGTSITVTVPASLATGTYDIRVTTPAGTSAITSADQFTVTAGPIVSITLQGRFTLIGWVGADGMSVEDALKGGPNGPQNGTNDITDQVSVVWAFDTASQTFKGYFPSAANIPGANDLTSLTFGQGYFIGLANPSAGTVIWKVAIGSPAS